MDIIDYNQSRLVCLLDDHSFKLELRAFRRAFKRLSVRLRNNFFTAKLKQLANLGRRLENNFPAQLFRSYHERIGRASDKKQRVAVGRLRKLTDDLIGSLDEYLDKTLEVYCMSQSRLKIGHLIQHYIVIRACISRLRIFVKALLVYSCDLSSAISDYLQPAKNTPKITNPQDVLIKHSCKPRVIVKEDKEKKISDFETVSLPNSEKIGQLIDRNEFDKAQASLKRMKTRQSARAKSKNL